MLPGIIPGAGLLAHGATAYSYRTAAQSTVSGSSFSFLAQDIGEASTLRLVVIMGGGGGNSSTVSSVTIAGNAMTVVDNGGGVGDANDFRYSWLAYRFVPTGATANIVVNWTGAQSSTAIAVFAVYPRIGTITQTIGALSSGATTLSDTSDVTSGGVALWSGMAQTSSALTGASNATGSAVAEHYDAQIGTKSARFAAYSQQIEASGSGKTFSVERSTSGSIGIAGIHIA